MTNLRDVFKHVNWIYALNASVKARAVKKTYADTVARYARTQKKDLHLPALPAAKDSLRPHAPAQQLNIFFVGTDEQQDRSGILQALGRLGQLRYFTRADGSYGQNDPRPAAVRRAANTDRLWELVKDAASAGEAPHVLIAQTWASVIDPRVFARIKFAYGTLIINISMDDRHQYWGAKTNGEWGGTFGLIPFLDLALTAAPECVEWYEKEGCPAFFFPEASDPAIFHPMRELPKIHDVSFVGGCYGIRKKIVNAIRRAGINVVAFGNGWEHGRIATENVPALFAQSKIILGVGTIGHCRDFYALKMRDFDAPMSGSLYLTHDNPDLHPLFETGGELATYRTVADCVEKVRHYLQHYDQREAVAAAGRARAVSEHTWRQRFSDLLQTITAGA